MSYTFVYNLLVMTRLTRGVRLGIVRGIHYGLFARPEPFVPQARALGARLVRAYLYWSQVEPRPGEFVFDTLDTLLDQLDGDEEVWLTLCSSSPWATRQPTDFLPASPALDIAAYAEFVRQVVTRCAGRVAYWQCDNEPSNSALWAGTADEYVLQLRAMHRSVKSVDPDAAVVLGGCGYDVLSSPPNSPERQFFDRLADTGRDAFDCFDVHLYGDPYGIPDDVETAREFMRGHGYARPVLAGEYSGPSIFEFRDVEAALQEVLVSAFAEPPAAQSTAALRAGMTQETPERRGMRTLYAHLADLPERLQMFMQGCSPELEARRHRIASRQVVVRNLLALAAGLDRTTYWNLAPEVAGRTDPYMLMHLLVAKYPLIDYVGHRLARRHPAADTFALLASELDGVEQLDRIEVPDQPAVYAFSVQRARREPLLVVWERRDSFDGESEPPVDVRLPWSESTARAIDAFGKAQPAEVVEGEVRFAVSDTPLFIACAAVMADEYARRS
jgi:hypothetical protein